MICLRVLCFMVVGILLMLVDASAEVYDEEWTERISK